MIDCLLCMGNIQSIQLPQSDSLVSIWGCNPEVLYPSTFIRFPISCLHSIRVRCFDRLVIE